MFHSRVIAHMLIMQIYEIERKKFDIKKSMRIWNSSM